MSKTRLLLDTSCFMMSGSNFSFAYLESLIMRKTHVFLLLNCVKRELTNKAELGILDAKIGMKRLERLLDLGNAEAIYYQQDYADDPICEYLRKTTDSTDFISRDRELKQRVFSAMNPHVRVFDITNSGKIHPFDPEYQRAW